MHSALSLKRRFPRASVVLAGWRDSSRIAGHTFVTFLDRLAYPRRKPNGWIRRHSGAIRDHSGVPFGIIPDLVFGFAEIPTKRGKPAPA